MTECQQCEELIKGIEKVNNEGVKWRRKCEQLESLLRELVLVEAAKYRLRHSWTDENTSQVTLASKQLLKTIKKAEAMLGGKRDE